MKPIFKYSSKPALEPNPGSPWADTMVLNPAIVKDPQTNILHMLFRATGPYPSKKMSPEARDPYPIFLGYAKSRDLGKSWIPDFSRPALSPALEYRAEDIYVYNIKGEKTIDYVNGCIEDPRIFEIEGELYMTVAGRLFPPGPYWDLNPDGIVNIPKWALEDNNALGLSKKTIDNTTSVLYKLDLEKLKDNDYDNSFSYICNLTDPVIDDNRDVVLFPEKMKIHDKMQYVMIHRPHNPENFSAGKGYTKPSIMLAAAENIEDFISPKATHKFLANDIFEWEDERIGASWQPLKIGNNEWLLPYHGKAMPHYGYTQSFMILSERENDFPKIIHRCPERLMYPQQEWEMPDKFQVPCLFTTGGVVIGDTLIISYGAADEKVGISWVNFPKLIAYIKTFDARGQKII